MGALSEIKKALSRRLVPLLVDLEKIAHRYGYLRLFAASLTLLSSVGVLGLVLGVTWLRIVFATVAAGLFVLSSALVFAASYSLRLRVERSEKLAHAYADALKSSSKVSIKEWHQEVVIEGNGDAKIKRTMVVGPCPARDIPRHLSVNMIYYGVSPLTDRDKRRVLAKVEHSEPQRATGGVRAIATSAWTTSGNGHPRLDVYVHLGRNVQENDTITVTWDWPRFSRDVMEGRATEVFDVVFRKKVGLATHSVIFRGVGGSDGAAARLRTRSHCSPLALERRPQGDDLVVDFRLEQPAVGRRYGFTADYRKND